MRRRLNGGILGPLSLILFKRSGLKFVLLSRIGIFFFILISVLCII